MRTGDRADLTLEHVFRERRVRGKRLPDDIRGSAQRMRNDRFPRRVFSVAL